ncbi:MAG: GNAT family N-acetyltransferase [Pirellulaceae bacterium]|nr:GNAT family N-acetyltransferase [Pirellulaceae bacterium]
MSKVQPTQMLIENPTPVERQTLIPAMLVQGSAEEQQKIDFLLSVSIKQLVPWRGHSDWTTQDFLRGLWVVRTAVNTTPIAAIWGHPAPGATALMGKPVSLISGPNGLDVDSTPLDLELQCQLVAKAMDWAKTVECEMLQAVVEPCDDDFSTALKQNGLQKLVDLVYLASPNLAEPNGLAHRRPQPQTSGSYSAHSARSSRFAVVPPHEGNLQRWYRLLESTYEESRDCPAINGRRSLANTVAGYMDSGTYWENGWVIVQESDPQTSTKLPSLTFGPSGNSSSGTDLGGFILADHPSSDFMELIYFGISPGARGQGWGIRILNEASRLAQQIGRSRIITAVDRENLPALRVYAAADYTALEEKAVFARFFPFET